ncbi:MAG: hypothetical protein ABFD98_17070 [Syntrophobacteraceae bacterium]|nr:hypothetical protein [Desulfobacteraceae bacterium]
MNGNQEQKTCSCVALGVRLALSLALLFPLYAFLYLTYPASLVALYLVLAVLVAIFAPWEELRKKFLS